MSREFGGGPDRASELRSRSAGRSRSGCRRFWYTASPKADIVPSRRGPLRRHTAATHHKPPRAHSSRRADLALSRVFGCGLDYPRCRAGPRALSILDKFKKTRNFRHSPFSKKKIIIDLLSLGTYAPEPQLSVPNPKRTSDSNSPQNLGAVGRNLGARGIYTQR